MNQNKNAVIALDADIAGLILGAAEYIFIANLTKEMRLDVAADADASRILDAVAKCGTL